MTQIIFNYFPMKVFLFISVSLLSVVAKTQQALPEVITAERARAHLGFLAADSLHGRGNGTWKLHQAARYIADEFAAAGLKPLPGEHSWFLPFSLYGQNKLPPPVLVRWNGKTLDEKEFQWIGKEPIPENTLLLHDFTVIHHDSAFSEKTVQQNWPGTGNLVLWTTIPQADKKRHFPRKLLPRNGGQDRNILLVYCREAPESLQATPNNDFIEYVGLNVAGYLPGKRLPKEKLLVGAHYDHEGSKGPKRDPIMNGANDNASGTTAMLLLARYFGQSPAPERSLVFMAFSGEEMGLLGSTYQAQKMNSKEIVAMVNLEMLGIPQYGAKTVFITGSGHSGLPALLSESLSKHDIKIVPEPSGQGLFFRSDNLGFAELGVPAHTIMASDDTDPCYHKPCDDTGRVDFDNLKELTRGIAGAIEFLSNRQEKPKRIRPASMIDIR